MELQQLMPGNGIIKREEQKASQDSLTFNAFKNLNAKTTNSLLTLVW